MNKLLFYVRIILGFFFLYLSAGFTSGQQQNWNWGGSLDPVQSTFEVTHTLLDLELFPDQRSISGKARLSLHYLESTASLRFQLISGYEVSNVEGGGRSFHFTHKNDILDIAIGDHQPESITISYGGPTPIASNPPWIGGFTWEKDDQGYHWMGLSSQNEGGKLFMPCIDHPESKPKDGVSLHIKVPEPYFVAANGVLVKTTKGNDKLTYSWESKYPIMNYNVNFTMGKFHKEEMVFPSVSGKTVSMAVYVLEENKGMAPMLLEVLRQSAETHEKYFGPYPFPDEKIAVVETPYLGMEHQTINAYGNNFQFVRMGEAWYDHLLHHELGHEWFGNKVSISDWADFWIHEGITSYGDWLFYLHHVGEEAYHDKAADARRRIINERPLVGKPKSMSDDAYHPDIYTKGAYILHSLRFIVGDEKFFPLLKNIAANESFTYTNQINTAKLIQFITDETNQDLDGFFDWYLYRTKLPKVKISRRKKTNYEVSIPRISFSLPVEIQTERGIDTFILSSKPVRIQSKTPINIDPNHWYLLEK